VDREIITLCSRAYKILNTRCEQTAAYFKIEPDGAPRPCKANIPGEDSPQQEMYHLYSCSAEVKKKNNETAHHR
jgi:hypothetical protein